MAIDIVGIVLILLSFMRGFSKGLIVATFSLVAILLGIIVSLKLSQTFADWLLNKGVVAGGWVPIICYIVLFVIVVFFVNLVARFLQKAIESLKLGIVNKLAGGVMYLILGLIIWSSILWFGKQMQLFPADTIASSRTFNTFYQLAPKFFESIGKILPIVKDTFANLQHFFDTVNKKSA